MEETPKKAYEAPEIEETVKETYEPPKIEEHEPLEESTATIYYYYRHLF